MRPLIPVCFLVTLLLSGCDRDAGKVERARQAADSWAATLKTTVDQWSSERLPTTYVRQIADAAERALTNEAESLEGVSAEQADGGQVRERLRLLRHRAGEVRRAADRFDIESARSALTAPPPRPSGTDAPGGRPS